jgi:hypothetical protein
LEQFKQGIPLKKLNVPELVYMDGNQIAEEHSKAIAGATEPFSLASSFAYRLGSLDNLIDIISSLSLESPTPKQVIEANNEFFAIRLISRENADMSKFEEQKSSIISSLLFQRKRSFSQQYITQLKAKAKIKYNEGLMGAMPSME